VTAVTALLGVLDCAFDKRGWHGPNLTSALRGVDPAAALLRPRGRKCVWEQLLHAAYWKHRALGLIQRASGASRGRSARFPRRGSNWPAPPARADGVAWRADLELLRDLHRRLRDVVARLPPAGVTPKVAWLVHGAAAHDLYHAGQIKLLRRLTRA
jgi:hypothetical protein